MESTTEKELLADLDSSDVYFKRFTELRLKCEKLLEVRDVQDTPSRASSVAGANVAGSYVNNASGKRKFKLPRIEFKLYDGHIKCWFPFWSQFQKIHDDIDEGDKIEYLRQDTIAGQGHHRLHAE